MTAGIVTQEYVQWVASLKNQIQAARSRAVLAVNAEVIHLYHRLGVEILERQERQRWGAKVVEVLAADLRDAFPDMRGLSARNLKYMVVFARLCPDLQFGQQAAAQLPWFHIVTLLVKVADEGQRAWYARRAVEEGWSRATLEGQIKSRLHLRQGAAITNFAQRLPDLHARLASEVLKDPYHFDFLGLGEEAHEHDIESALMRHFYLAAVDAQMKADDDGPTIGLLLCKTKKKLVAEYALSGIQKPMGVAEYQLVRALPEPLDTKLPTIEELEEGLRAALESSLS